MTVAPERKADASRRPQGRVLHIKVTSTLLHQGHTPLNTAQRKPKRRPFVGSWPRIVALEHKEFSQADMSLPPSSPRLPSPPPPTEIQIGPKSPSLSSSTTQEPSIEQSIIDANASRRIHPGTKSADMAAGPPLIPLNEVGLVCPLYKQLLD